MRSVWRLRRRRCFRSVAVHGDDDFAAAGPVIEVAEDDLLPRAEGEAAFRDGIGFGGSHEGAAEVGIAVVVAPAGVVGVVGVGGGDGFEGAAEIADAAGFVFDGGDGEGGADSADVDHAGADAARVNDALNLGADVDDVGVAFGVEADAVLMSGHARNCNEIQLRK